MSRASSLVVIALVAACPLGACFGDDLNETAMNAALATAAQSATPSGASLGTAAQPWGVLGDHSAEVSLVFTLKPREGATQRLSLHRLVHRRSDGAFHRLDERTWKHGIEATRGADDGRECVFDGAHMASRRRWGPWKRRAEAPAHARKVLLETYDPLSLALDVFKPYLVETPGAQEIIMKRPARWTELSLNKSNTLPALQIPLPTEHRFHELGWGPWMARTHRVESVNGRVARDEETGEFVRADLALQGTANVEGEEAGFELRVGLNLFPLRAAAAFVIPANAFPAERRRPWAMVKSVLGDALRQIYRR